MNPSSNCRGFSPFVKMEIGSTVIIQNRFPSPAKSIPIFPPAKVTSYNDLLRSLLLSGSVTCPGFIQIRNQLHK